MALRYSLPASALLIAACAGGGGSFSGDFQDTQERAPGSLEGAAATNKRSAVSNEGIASTNEHAGPAGGSGTGAAPVAAFSCLGTFRCAVSTDLPGTKSQVPTTTLRLPGVCNYQGSGLNPDGTVTKDGKVLGSWQVTSTGFRVTESATTATSVLDGGTTSLSINITLDCTKISDSITGDDDDFSDDDDDAPPPPSSSFDAGAR